MNRPCPKVIDCPGSDSPILNISSEAPDRLMFIGTGYTPFSPYRPPPLGGPGLYFAKDCQGESFSVLSQEIADLLAQITAEFCQTGQPLQYSNSPQTASLLCPSGATFFYTVPAGMFLGPVTPVNPDDEAIEASIAAANAAALAYAQQQVSAQLCCLTMTGSVLCIGQPAAGVSFTAHANQLGANFGLEVVGGTLPPGTSFVQTGPLAAELQGVPSQLGSFTFDVRAFTATAEVVQPFTVTVQLCAVNILHLGPNPGWVCLGVDLDPDLSGYQVTGLPAGVPCTFVLLSGSLPPGVSLVQTGLQTAELDGIPTAAGVYTYTIQAYRTDLPGEHVEITETLSVFGITNPTLPDGTTGVAYSEQLLTSGGTAPVTFSGTPPTGLTLHSDGTIDGTPTLVSATPFTVTITDNEGAHCTQDVTLNVVSAVICASCAYSDVLASIVLQPACLPSANPAWDGIFNLTSVWHPPQNYPMWYFINQSILGCAVAASDGPNYPAGDWQNMDLFTQLYWDGAEWQLWIVCANGGGDVWFGSGSVNPLDASGDYTYIDGSSVGLTTIRINHYGAGYCLGVPPPALFGLSAPHRVRIKDWITVGPSVNFSGCTPAGPGMTVWDGTFPDQLTPGAGIIDWYIADLGPPYNRDRDINGFWEINANVMFNPGGPDWELLLWANGCGFVWQGVKNVGLDPTGVYVKIAGSSPGPGCLTIESY